jgi:hypothetical protein
MIELFLDIPKDLIIIILAGLWLYVILRIQKWREKRKNQKEKF